VDETHVFVDETHVFVDETHVFIVKASRVRYGFSLTHRKTVKKRRDGTQRAKKQNYNLEISKFLNLIAEFRAKALC
ncbi:MAG: hypothetical protein RMY28_000540, partial [Nostoc sp. ChiSLP01]|nr:hypothetical protein [Nostoc sp. CmiSLP01]